MSENKKFTFEDKEYSVVRPSAKVTQAAQRLYSAEFMKCINEGLMVKPKLKQFLEEHGIWTKDQEKKEKEIADEINALELELYRGGGKGKKITLTEGKEKALKIKELRASYMELIAERQSYESNTAESVADNARFDYLVSECTLNADGTKVYNSFEDYQSKSSDDLAYTAASNLAQLIYALEDDYIKKLPENHFLSTFGLVDEELRLVNKEGKLVDKEGRVINDEGHYLDKDGNRVDKFGNPLTEDGFFEFDITYVDDEGKEVVPKDVEEEESEDEAEEVEVSTIPPVPVDAKRTPAKKPIKKKTEVSG